MGVWSGGTIAGVMSWTPVLTFVLFSETGGVVVGSRCCLEYFQITMPTMAARSSMQMTTYVLRIS